MKPGRVRIIGGLWKRSLIPVADFPGLRPSPDRVRETLFNWLGQDLTRWRCVDAFAGTGALGIEAASRGSELVVLVEKNSALVDQLKKIQKQLNAQALDIIRGDGLNYLNQLPAGLSDLIFLDPPFDSDLYASALQASAIAIQAQGFIYLEAAKKWSEAELAGFGLCTYRHLKAGAVHAHLLKLVA